MKQKPLNVLHLNGRSDFGGGPKNMHRLLNSIDKKNFRFFAACPQEPPYFEKLGQIEELTLFPLPLRRLTIKNLLTLHRIVRQNHIHIVHSQGKAAGVWSRLLKLFFPRLTVIHHFRGIHYKQYPQWFHPVYFFLERCLSLLTNQIIHVSESEKQEALNLKLCPAQKQKIICNGVETFSTLPWKKSQARKNLELSGDKPISMVISRYSFQKNLSLSFQVIQELVRSGTSIRFIVVGGEDDIPESEIKKEVQERGIEENVILVGSQENIIEWLCAADFYFTTARWEGLPTAVLEAMSVSLPVVASNVTGNNSVVRKETGYLVEEENIQAYVEAILSLLSNSTQFAAMGDNGKNLISAQFSIDQMVSSHEELYLKFFL